jgi:membrane protease YdiL (CAAX protease family)
MRATSTPPSGAGARANPLMLLLVYLLIVFIGGALLGPQLYLLVKQLGQSSTWFEHLSRHPFHRFVHRSMLDLAIVGIWPFSRKCGLHWRDLKAAFSNGQLNFYLRGFAVTFVSLALAIGVALLAGGRRLHISEPLGNAIIVGVVAAVLAGTLEELLFRFAVFGTLRQKGHWVSALLISSALYAIVHFFTRTAEPPLVTWQSGFFTLKEMLHGFVDARTLVPGFINLTLVGIILGLAYQRTGGLGFSIGAHGGWILALKLFTACTVGAPRANQWLWGTNKMVDGWLSFIVLLAVFFFVHFNLRKPREK